MLWPACSRDRLTRPFASKASAVSLPPLPPRLLLAGATVARWDLHPLKNDAFARRTDIPQYFASESGEKRRFAPRVVLSTPGRLAGATRPAERIFQAELPRRCLDPGLLAERPAAAHAL